MPNAPKLPGHDTTNGSGGGSGAGNASTNNGVG
jgi:hypothetical protein